MNDKTEIATRLICGSLPHCVNFTAKDITKFCKYAQQIIDACKTPEDVVPKVTPLYREVINPPIKLNGWAIKYLNATSKPELDSISEEYTKAMGPSIVGLIYSTLQYIQAVYIRFGDWCILGDDEVWPYIHLEGVGRISFRLHVPANDSYAYTVYIWHPGETRCYGIKDSTVAHSREISVLHDFKQPSAVSYPS